MSAAETNNDLSIWLSTYGLITTERILESYKIRLQHEDLIAAIKNPNSFYHRLLRVPLKNVFNGIILQQANDYQVYAQKIFIDYLMSGETSKSEDSPGALTREDLESERKRLVNMGDDFHACETEHNKLIAESQKNLIQFATEWKKNLAAAAKKIRDEMKLQGVDKEIKIIIQVINALIIQWDSSKRGKIDTKDKSWLRAEKIIGEKMSENSKHIFIDQITKLLEFSSGIESSLADFTIKTNEMGARVRQWRSDFYKLILRVNELLQLLPEYHVDSTQTEENRETLYFDSTLGEDQKG